MKKLLLALLCCICCAAGLHAQTILLSEDFSTGVDSIPPTGWTQNIITGDSAVDWWFFDNPGARVLNPPITTPAAIFDSDDLSNNGQAEDVALESPAFDATGQAAVNLSFDHFFNGGFGGAYEVEVFNGTAWVSVLSGTASTANPASETIDISAQAAGVANAQVRFRWTGNWSFYWILDNVIVSTPPSGDLGVTAISSPGSACSLSATEAITVEITNFGSAPQSSFDVSYSINGGTPVGESYTGAAIPVGGSGTYTFLATADFSTPGPYDVQAYTQLGLDADTSNDSTTATIQNLGGTTLALPFVQNFDTFSTGTSGILSGGWSNVGPNNWFADAGGTPSSGTGPGVDNTLGTSAGVYLFTEATGRALGDKFITRSPCIDLSGGTTPPRLSYFYHMHGEDMGTLEVYVSGNSGRVRVDSIGGEQQANQSDPWLESVIDMSAFAGQTVFLEFEATRGDDFESDIAIDDVSLFFPSGIDLSPTALVNPAVTTNCFGSSEILTFTVENVGVDTSFFNVNQIDLTVIGTGANTINLNNPITGPTFLAPGASANATTPAIDLSNVGVTEVDIIISFTGDGEASNDTLSVTFTTLPTQAFPYVENFDTFTTGNPGVFFNGWANDPSANREWRVNSGTTTSGSTGPSADNTTGSGNYIYTEASSPVAQGDIFNIFSACVDLTGSTSPVLEYFYHMYGADIDRLDVFIESGGVVTLIDSIVGQQQNDNADPWERSLVDLSAFSGVIRAQFRVTAGPGFNGDVAIDDVGFVEAPATDLSITNALANSSATPFSCFGNNETLSISIQNGGSAIDFGMDSAIVSVSGTGANVFSDTLVINSGSLGLGEGGSFDLSGVDLSAVGSTNVQLIVSAAADTNAVNDTLDITLITQPVLSTYPFIQDFENGEEGWIASGVNSSWAFGTPAKSVITGTASGVNAWVTGGLGTATYNVNENSAVYSPCFDMTAAPQGAFVALAFWVESEGSFDGAAIQTSVDSGKTWQVVGAVGTGFNWYNLATITGQPGGQPQGWSGTGLTSYFTAFHPLDSSLIGRPDVRFRVAFGSDGSVNDDGFAFDNFAIALPSVVDLGPDSSLYCIGDSLDAGNPGSDYFWSTGDTTQAIALENNTGANIMDSVISVAVINEFGIISFDTIVVDILGDQPPSVTGLTIFDVLCNGDSTGSIDLTVAGDATPFSYSWDNGDTTQNLTGLPAGTYIGTITDTNGCVFVSPKLDVNEPTPITVALDTIGSAECPDDSSGFISINVSGGTTPYSYVWDNGDTTRDLTGLPGGVYTGTITDGNGCVLVSPALLVPNTDTLPMTPNIMVFDTIGSNRSFTTDSTDVLSYTWDFGDGSNPEVGRTVTHTYTANGTYTVTLSVTNNCGTTISTFDVTVDNVGIEDIFANAIKLYPNPSSGQFALSFDNLDIHKIAVKVSNMEGRIVFSENLGTRSGSFSHQVSLPATTAAGIYLVQVRIDDAVVYKRLQLK